MTRRRVLIAGAVVLVLYGAVQTTANRLFMPY